jgi:hypothetical protein
MTYTPSIRLALAAGFSFCLLALAPGCGEDTPPSIREPLKHRPSGSSCSADDSGSGAPSDVARGMVISDCQTDADCTGTNARCAPLDATGGICQSDQCQSDADCEGGGTCLCSSGGNRCLTQGNCQVDADCGGGENGFCSPSLGSCGDYGGIVGYFCHTDGDECTDDSDCADQDGGYCSFNQELGRWRCSTDFCVG